MRKKKFSELVKEARAEVLRYLARKEQIREQVLCQPLERYVVSCVNWRVKRDWSIVHETKPVHTLAFFLAFEELERENQITVDRKGLPANIIDNETVFKLAVKEGL